MTFSDHAIVPVITPTDFGQQRYSPRERSPSCARRCSQKTQGGESNSHQEYLANPLQKQQVVPEKGRRNFCHAQLRQKKTTKISSQVKKS